MFTGLIQSVGRVSRAERRDFGVRLAIDAGTWDYHPAPGDSVAVNGCCLTAIESDRGEDAGPELFVFDVIGETLQQSTLGTLQVGHRVNLEHAARADTLLGGHIVQGHVDGLGEVLSIHDDPGDWRIRIGAPGAVMQCIAPKGAVAIEGVSLTIARVEEPQTGAPAWFEVALIPTTLDLTNLRDRKAGDAVNLETDILARQVVHWMRYYAPGPR